jgi:hypothetical protein
MTLREVLQEFVADDGLAPAVREAARRELAVLDQVERDGGLLPAVSASASFRLVNEVTR